jgi:hypothetical protein
VTPALQRDLDALLDTVLPRAGHALGTEDEFAPFAATLSIDGVVVFLAVARTAAESSTDVDALDVLYEEAGDSKETLRAVAVAAVLHTRSGDYVRIEIERRDAEPLIVLVPYRRAWRSKRISFGNHAHFSGTPRIWLGWWHPQVRGAGSGEPA